MGLKEELRDRILILDGGMGTEIQSTGISYDGNNDALALSHPEIIGNIHRSYIDAGADIICTCTFNANRFSQQGFGSEDKVREINLAGACTARAAAESCHSRKIWVMGSIGPTPKSLTIAELMSDPADPFSYNSLLEAYGEQAEALVDGGVDGFIVETVTDLRNAEAALCAIGKITERKGIVLPVMVSATLMGPGCCLMTGSTVQEFVDTVSAYNPLSLGLNCSSGARQMIQGIRLIAEKAVCAVSVYPNAGLPTSHGYGETPCDTASAICEMAADGLINIAGGCCGTTPMHIREISARLKGIPPRIFP